MPMPLSRTLTTAWPCSTCIATCTLPPSGVYLLALLSRLLTTCCSRAASPCTHTGFGGSCQRQRLPAADQRRALHFDALRQQRAQLQRRGLQDDLALADARHVEQLVDQPRQLPHLAIGDVGGPHQLAVVAAEAADDLDARCRSAPADCATRATASPGTRPCAGWPSSSSASVRAALDDLVLQAPVQLRGWRRPRPREWPLPPAPRQPSGSVRATGCSTPSTRWPWRSGQASVAASPSAEARLQRLLHAFGVRTRHLIGARSSAAAVRRRASWRRTAPAAARRPAPAWPPAPAPAPPSHQQPCAAGAHVEQAAQTNGSGRTGRPSGGSTLRPPAAPLRPRLARRARRPGARCAAAARAARRTPAPWCAAPRAPPATGCSRPRPANSRARLHLVGVGGDEDDRRVGRALVAAGSASPSRSRRCRAC